MLLSRIEAGLQVVPSRTCRIPAALDGSASGQWAKIATKRGVPLRLRECHQVRYTATPSCLPWPPRASFGRHLIQRRDRQYPRAVPRRVHRKSRLNFSGVRVDARTGSLVPTSSGGKSTAVSGTRTWPSSIGKCRAQSWSSRVSQNAATEWADPGDGDAVGVRFRVKCL